MYFPVNTTFICAPAVCILVLQKATFYNIVSGVDGSYLSTSLYLLFLTVYEPNPSILMI